MKILSPTQIRELDRYTIEHEPISSLNLMERASAAFAAWFAKKYPLSRPVAVFSGVGNNGADGLAIARILKKRYGFQVRVYLVQISESLSEDFKANLVRLPFAATSLNSESPFPSLLPQTVLIDALLGSGLSRPIEGWLARLVSHMNEANQELDRQIVAVDVPSGLFCEKDVGNGAVVEADYTVSFELPKLAFLLPQNQHFVGDWQRVAIGLSEEGISEMETPHHYLDRRLAHSMVKARQKFSHKGTFGHLLILAGSYGKIGASVLCGKAALRAGAGLVSVHVPKCGYSIVQTAVPEIMCSTDPQEEILSELPDLSLFGTFAIGPGIGKSASTLELLKQLLKKVSAPTVFDADALNLLSENKELLNQLPAQSILTPHPKEFERLAGTWSNDFERLEKQKQFSITYQCFLVLKGAHTSVSTPQGEVFFNSTGNSGMATAGSGDVLTGIIASLLAQNYSPQSAALLGVYLHGLSGDLAVQAISKSSLIASDLIDWLGRAFLELES